VSFQEGGRNASGWWQMMCHVRDGVGSGLGSWFDDNTRGWQVMVGILSFGLIIGWMELL